MGFDKALIPWTLLVSIVGTLTGYFLHHVSRFLYSTQYLSSHSDSDTSTTPLQPANNSHPSAKQDTAQRPLSLSNLLPLSPTLNVTAALTPSPNAIHPVPTSPLVALLPPDSPLLSRYISPSPASRPTPDRNISYRSQMRELMTERQEQLIALYEEEKRRRTLSPRLSDAGSPISMSAHGRVGKDALSSPTQQHSSAISPLMARQRPGTARDRPISWPPLVVVEDGRGREEKQGLRTSSGGYGRTGHLDVRAAEDYRSNGMSPEPLTFPSVPRTIIEEDEDEDEDSSDEDFY